MESNKEEMLKVCDAKIAEFTKKSEDMKQKVVMWQTMRKELEKELNK